MYGTMLRFFTVNHKETTEYLIASYKYGSFTKVSKTIENGFSLAYQFGLVSCKNIACFNSLSFKEYSKNLQN